MLCECSYDPLKDAVERGSCRGQPSGLRGMSIVRYVRFSVAVLVALAASSVLTVASASAQVTWKLASAYPADNFHTQNLAAFANDVAQVTDGRLAIRIYPNASLLPASAIKSAVRIGQVQMGETLISLHDNENPIFGIGTLPKPSEKVPSTQPPERRAFRIHSRRVCPIWKACLPDGFGRSAGFSPLSKGVSQRV
jgi:extracellular solute-binding protein (family 7)